MTDAKRITHTVITEVVGAGTRYERCTSWLSARKAAFRCRRWFPDSKTWIERSRD